ncbi:MAG: DNA-binding transcriptional regulator Fis [Gammaproteobacteria bacterium]
MKRKPRRNSRQAPPAVTEAKASVSVDERSLRQHVEATLDNYFRQLDGQIVTDVYDMVLQEVEAPLLEAVLRYTRDNQTLASTVLGLNRGTLRKKLKRYGLL